MEVEQVVEGEYLVRLSPDADPVRVLVPAGVGVPGVSDEELAGIIVEELLARGHVPPPPDAQGRPGTLDVSQLLRGVPELLDAAAERARETGEDAGEA